MSTVRIQVVGRGPVELTPRRLFVAGFTGRDREAVEAHLEELRELGIDPPPTTPTLLELDPALVVVGASVTVGSSSTSGEVEPVLLVGEGGDLLLAVGSDHTDREVERSDIAASKAACPKVVASQALAVELADDLDALELRSWVDADEDPYQEGSLAQITPLGELVGFLRLSGVELRPGDVVFLGTIPAAGGMRSGERFRGELRHPLHGAVSQIDYEVRVSRTRSGELP